jgi:hypothetical protein
MLSRRCLVAAVVLCLLWLFAGTAQALTHESPEVRQAIARGQAFLLTVEPAVVGAPSKQIGHDALVALALYKSIPYGDPSVTVNHPRIQAAVSRVRAGISNGQVGLQYESVYATGLAIVLLSAVDAKAYRKDIEAATRILSGLQTRKGGFLAAQGAGELGGDTSMTQYAVLGLWEASAAGVAVAPQAWQGVTQWLMSTQLADGAFTYRPGYGVPNPTHSMAAGGLGSLYICANYVKKRGSRSDKEKSKDDAPPPVFTPVGGQKKEPEKASRGAISVDRGALTAALARGDAWMTAKFTVSPQQRVLYYLYAVERYYAFKEQYEGTETPEPQWYTDGATYLISKQRTQGAWVDDDALAVGTSFAVLFLARSTKAALKNVPKDEVASGTLLSGAGLPTDLSNIRVKDGKIVAKAMSGPAAELLEILENPSDPKFEAAREAMEEKLAIQPDDVMLPSHLVRLKKLAKSDKPEARAVAVTILGKSRDLANVPTLIYALNDEDPLVVTAAQEALRHVSRKFDGYPFVPGAKDTKDVDKKNKAIEQWKAWYRSVRPDAEFDN